MTHHRFFIDPELFDTAQSQRHIRLPEIIHHQVIKVLRLREGNEIVLCNGNGLECRAVIESDGVTCEIAYQNTREPRIYMTLYQSLIEREACEAVIRHASEVGVSRFVPLVTHYTQKSITWVDEKKRQRWQSIAREAAEQSERGIVPEIMPVQSLDQALASPRGSNETMICAAERGEKKFYPGMYSSPSIHLFIGPEGGWSSAELALFVARGIECVTFGERILKSETAGIVIPALLLQ